MVRVLGLPYVLVKEKLSRRIEGLVMGTTVYACASFYIC